MAEEYYVAGIPSAFDRKNWLGELNNYLNILVGVVFAFALIFVVVFVTLNVNGKENTMTDKKTNAPVVQKKVQINESATVPKMQQAPGKVVERSASVPKLQPAPSVEKPASKPAGKPATAPPSTERGNSE